MLKNISCLFNSIAQWFCINVDQEKNPHCRTYHTKFEISNHYIQVFDLPLKEDVSEKLEEIGEIGTSILNRLFKIPGIRGIFIKEYLLTIEKDEDTSWKEIQPKILDAIMPS